MGGEMGLPNDWIWWVIIIGLGLWLRKRAGVR